MNTKVAIHGDNVVFEVSGIHKVLSFKRTMTVALAHVKSVSTERAGWGPSKHFRILGSFLPGVVKDGRFVTRGGLIFSEMRHPDRCVTLALNSERYKQIIFEVADKESVAKMIRDAVARQRAGLA